MRFVTADQPGKNIKLHPGCSDRIFTDVTDDEQDLVLVKGRIIRVDEPSGRLYEALTQTGYGQAPNRHPLLVETTEAPTEAAPVTVLSLGKNSEQLLEELKTLAQSLGYNLAVAGEPPTPEPTPTPDQVVAADSGENKAKK